MIPSRTRIAFLFRRWYWNQPYHTRWMVSHLPGWLLAIAIGLFFGILISGGF